jgi:hypothetical protein
MIAQDQAYVSYDARKEPKRGETRVRMRVTNPRCLRLQLGENNSIPIGTHEIEVWAREVPGILALVETDHALVKQAFVLFEKGIAKLVTDKLTQFKGKTLAQLREIAPTNADLATVLDDEMARTGDSPQARFHQLTEGERGMLPLDAAEVLVEGLPEKSDVAAVEGQQQLAKIISEAVATALGAALASERQGKK